MGLGRDRGHLRYVAELSIYILDNDPLVLYVYPALRACILPSDRCGVTWASNDGG